MEIDSVKVDKIPMKTIKKTLNVCYILVFIFLYLLLIIRLLSTVKSDTLILKDDPTAIR